MCRGWGLRPFFFDYDKDGWPDIYIANDKEYTHNTLYRNLGNGSFEDVSDPMNTGMYMDGMGVGVGDYDNNGYLDVYVTNTPQSSFDFAGNLFLHNNGDGTFEDVGVEKGVKCYKLGWGTNFVDLDNDSDLDLFVANGNMGGPFTGNNSLYINQGTAVFWRIPSVKSPWPMAFILAPPSATSTMTATTTLP